MSTRIDITTGGFNFANTNLTFTANRAHNTAGFDYLLSTDNGVFNQAWQSLSTLQSSIGFANSLVQADVTSCRISADSTTLDVIPDGNFHFEQTTGKLPTSGAGAIVLKNRTAPSTNVIDRCYVYSSDAVAGNACFTTRSELGDIFRAVKSAAYTPTNVTTTRTFNANATTLDELADVLGTFIADMQANGLAG